MHYLFQLLPHPNALYREAMEEMAAKELVAMLEALGVSAPVTRLALGGSIFMSFEATLSDDALNRLSQHSSLLLLCAEEGGLLRPLNILRPDYFPREVAEVLKYKGKTNAGFTRMMINLALSAAGVSDPHGATLLDPMCGRGTTLYCGL